MPLNVYFREDIQNALHSAGLDSGAPPRLVEMIQECKDQEQLAALIEAYQHGHARALQKVGAAFGMFVLIEEK